ncbi:MAG: hypothetical protein ABH878_04090 [bacterium]
MQGYFIPAEKAEELDLLNNPEIRTELQATIIVVTKQDLNVESYPELNDAQLEEIANWFYRNYYDCFLEVVQGWQRD